jgi:glutamine amidotransferase
VQSWVHEVDSGVTVHASDADFSTWSHEDLTGVLALNVLWAEGGTLAGARLNRTLWGLQRRSAYACPVCGEEHADSGDDEAYRVVALASERITAEDWFPIPNGSVFSVDRTASLHTEALNEA